MAFYNRKLLIAAELSKPGSDSNPTPCSQCKPNPGAKHQIPTLLVLSLGIVGALFLFLSYFAMRRFAGRRRSSPPPPVNYTNREDFTEIDHPIWYIRTVGVPQSVVDSIQMVRYKKGEGLIETSDCSVCLNEFGEGDRLRLLHKCGHAFHVACIDTWLRSHTNCPLCRAPVNGTPVESSSSEGEGGGGGGGGGDINGEDDGVVVNAIHHHQEQEMIKAVTRRSVSMDISSNVEHNKPFSINRSISFTFYA